MAGRGERFPPKLGVPDKLVAASKELLGLGQRIRVGLAELSGDE